jgi:transcription initiation factor TFIIIB Brf1 subunit/transcription initiation factor TFIIB
MAAGIQNAMNECAHVPPVVDPATSEMFCPNCGLVMEGPDRIVQYQAENPQHAPGSGSNPRSILRRKDGQGHIIPHRNRNQFDRASRRMFRGDRRVTDAMRRKDERAVVERCIARFGFVLGDRLVAMETYRMVRDKGVPITGHSREIYAGACIFLGLRRAGRPIPLLKICDELGVTRRTMNGMVNRIVRKVPSLLHTSTTAEVMTPLRPLLKAVEFAQVAKVAAEWWEVPEIRGHSPRGVAAAAAYYVLGWKRDPRFSQQKCCAIMGVNDVTVRGIFHTAQKTGAASAR